MIREQHRLLAELGLAMAFPRSGLHRALAPKIVRAVRRAKANVRARVHFSNFPDQDQPALFCGFHFCGHLAIPRAVSKRVPLALLTDAENFIHLQTARDSFFADGWGHVPVLVNANDLGAAYQLYRSLEAGLSVFVWGDGNNGISPPHLGGTAATFLAVPIRIHASFLQLAQLAQVRAHALFPDDSRSVFKLAPLSVGKDEAKHGMLRMLEGCVRSQPENWVEWHQLPLWADFDRMMTIDDTGIDENSIDLQIRNQRLRFDRDTGAVAIWRAATWQTVV